MTDYLHNKKLLKFIRGVILLTLTGLIMRSVAVNFNVYLTAKLGTEGMGLFSLIGSVYGFAITFATSAVNLASTRLVSEALGKSDHRAVRSSMAKCIAYSMAFGFSACILLILLARPIGAKLLSDPRTVLSLRAFALSLPCISLTSCLNGYFTAVRRVSKNAAVQICEQAVRVGGCFLLLSFFMPSSLEYACLCVVLAGCCADILSFLYSFIMYRIDLKRHIGTKGDTDSSLSGGLLSIAIPVALSSYVRSALVTVEHLLIPWGMRKMGSSRAASLKTYGVMQAMALPVVMFPYALLSPFCSLIIPEVAERRARSDESGIARVSSGAIGFVLIFGIGISGIMAFYSAELGQIVCKSAEAARYIKILAPLLPIMYLDTVTDSILKGLDEQLYTMRINIMDAFLSVITVFVLVPRIGIYGYIAEIFICEIINASFSVWKLITLVKFRFGVILRGLFPLISIISATLITRFVLGFFPLGEAMGGLILTLQIVFTLLLYLLGLFILYSLFAKERLTLLFGARSRSSRQRKGSRMSIS